MSPFADAVHHDERKSDNGMQATSSQLTLLTSVTGLRYLGKDHSALRLVLLELFGRIRRPLN